MRAATGSWVTITIVRPEVSTASRSRPRTSAADWPRLMAYTDWRMRAVDGLGLDFATMVRIAIMVSTHTQGAAYPLAREKQASSTREQWMNTRSREVREAFGSGELPMIARFDFDAFEASEPQSIFEFGLQRLLDGIGSIIPA
jgi:hypothetical protein